MEYGAQADGMQQLDFDGLVYLKLLGVVITFLDAVSPRAASLAAYMRQRSFDACQNTTHIGRSDSRHSGVAARNDTSRWSERNFLALGIRRADL